RRLSVDDTLRLLHGLGQAEVGAAACHYAIPLLRGRLEELDTPRRLVRAVEALGQCADLVGRSHRWALAALCELLVARMVDFRAEDVTAVAVVFPRLRVADEAALEAVARQALRQKPERRRRAAAAALRACEAAGFQHRLVGELRGSAARPGREAERSSPEAEGGAEEGGAEGGAGGAAAPAPEAWGDALEDAPLFEEPWLEVGRAGASVSSRAPPGSAAGSAGAPGTVAAAGPGAASAPPAAELALAGAGELAASQAREQEDKAMRRLLRDVDRQVLRPAGFRGEGLMTPARQAGGRAGAIAARGPVRARRR
ncbi:unnamed protein product, partial [Prorocentrum cordatum]